MPNNLDDTSVSWYPISSAPFDRELELSVIEDGKPLALVFPCRRDAGGWMNARTGRQIDVWPTHWRPWSA